MIWTSNVEKNKLSVVREIKRAIGGKKGIYLVQDRRTKPTHLLPERAKEHLKFDIRNPMPQFIKLVENILSDWQEGIFQRDD